MAYTGSKAVAGINTVVSIGPKLGGAGDYLPIFELKDASRSGNSWKKADVTNFNSGTTEETRKTILTPGTYKLDGNDISDDPGQVALLAAFNDPEGAYQFKIEYAKDADQQNVGDVETFAAIVTGYDRSNKVGEIRTVSVEITVSGISTYTVGN